MRHAVRIARPAQWCQGPVGSASGSGKNRVVKAIAYSALRFGPPVLYGEADELQGEFGHASSAEKRNLLKPIADADLLVLDDPFWPSRSGR